jgi:hypothetical protein
MEDLLVSIASKILSSIKYPLPVSETSDRERGEPYVERKRDVD